MKDGVNFLFLKLKVQYQIMSKTKQMSSESSPTAHSENNLLGYFLSIFLTNILLLLSLNLIRYIPGLTDEMLICSDAKESLA